MRGGLILFASDVSNSEKKSLRRELGFVAVKKQSPCFRYEANFHPQDHSRKRPQTRCEFCQECDEFLHFRIAGDETLPGNVASVTGPIYVRLVYHALSVRQNMPSLKPKSKPLQFARVEEVAVSLAGCLTP